MRARSESMYLNGHDPTLPAPGLEDRGHEHNQMDHFDCAGDFPAYRNRTWNVLWAAPVQGIFGRRYSLHAGRGRAAGTTRTLRDPATVQVDLLQPVRLHDRV